MGIQVYIDGAFFPKEEAKVSVFDHGFLYGDGVFEGIRVYNGRIFKLKEHLERLYESAHHILLNIPLSLEEMEQATIETVQAGTSWLMPHIRIVVSRRGRSGLDPENVRIRHRGIIADKISLPGRTL